MGFTAQNMLGGQVLVTGTDTTGASGSAIVDSTQWDELKARKTFDASKEAFDTAVEQFFAPLTEAVEAMEQAVARPPHDSLSYVVIHEAVEGVNGQPEEIVELTNDSIILRCIEEGTTDRLLWLDEHTLGVLAA